MILIKKGMKVRHQIHNIFDFLAVTERIDIKLVGTLKGSYACISDRLSFMVPGNKKLFFSQISHFMISDRIIRVTIHSVFIPNHVSGSTKRYVERTISVYNT